MKLAKLFVVLAKNSLAAHYDLSCKAQNAKVKFFKSSMIFNPSNHTHDERCNAINVELKTFMTTTTASISGTAKQTVKKLKKKCYSEEADRGH